MAFRLDEQELVARYTAVLESYLRLPREESLLEAYNLVHQAMSTGRPLSLSFLISTHHEALATILDRQKTSAPVPELIRRAATIFAESCSPYEMILRGYQRSYQEALISLKRLNQELKVKSEQLEVANASLREVDQLKDQFLSITSHELRTPINAIMGFGSILEDEMAGPLTPEQHKYLGSILSGAGNLLNLVNDLLDMGRIQAGKFSLSPRMISFEEVVTSVVANLEPLALKKRLRVLQQIEGVLPPLCADEQRVAQILTNLLTNAIKFSPDGQEITVTASADTDWLSAQVIDHAEGIAPEDIPKLFKQFGQLDTSSTRKFGGTGLGLSISKALVEAHGGEIGVRSQVGVGSTFWFTLPLGARTCTAV